MAGSKWASLFRHYKQPVGKKDLEVWVAAITLRFKVLFINMSPTVIGGKMVTIIIYITAIKYNCEWQQY